MSLPVRHLPVVQNWDCQGCGQCCREYQVGITEEERQRIIDQGWENEPALGGLPLFVRGGPWYSRQWQLNHKSDGSCVFLNEKGLCRIHDRFGAETKPLACRLYPFILVKAGDHLRVGVRFGCPSAAASKGRPISEHHKELLQYAAGLDRRGDLDPRKNKVPRLQVGQTADWSDVHRFVQAMQAILGNREERFERRMRKCLALAAICRQARFDKVTGGRLVEFLNLLGAGLEGEVPPHPLLVPPPSWVGRILFRQVAALYCRKDHGVDRSLISRSRLALLRAAVRFVRGRGPVPRLHARIPQTTFERAEIPAGPLSPEEEAVLERYYLIKVGSCQFFGPTQFGVPLWEGVESLGITLAVILWLARLFRDMPRPEGIILAVSIVDNNFGFNKLLGTLRQRLSHRILAQRGELERLIAWYSR